MKYSIERLDKIQTILKERAQEAEKACDDIFFSRRKDDEAFWNRPGYQEADEAFNKCTQGIKKIDKLFSEVVDDFLNEEIELEP